MSSRISWPIRRGSHGEPLVSIHHRNASAPCRSSASQGSNMLPSDFDIFLPSSAMMWPRHTTLRYVVASKCSTPSAISV